MTFIATVPGCIFSRTRVIGTQPVYTTFVAEKKSISLTENISGRELPYWQVLELLLYLYITILGVGKTDQSNLSIT